ncbi:Cuticlin-1 [Toxocara canis]|uniref:Cuticlin-1 n=1 Tax=Toxocara canis TaxID=6265 RepID=A0A0B2VC11_TOXCA|nr:Cuticlin-1 [Toxocara canis]
MLAVLILCLAVSLCTAIDYEDNDLAKVCRPLDRQLDLLFILDGSGSVSGSTFDTQMAMLNRIVEMVEIGPDKTQIAVMQYSSYTRVEFGFTANANKEKLRTALQKIHHISGTTKTGKALDKALQVFKHSEISGARVNHEDVAQIAVVVTDGHSHDDPVPAAQRLRQAGVQILTLGIGAHINMGELIDITGDETLAFQNLTSQASLDKFVNQFKKIAVGEHCDFSRGPHGAEIICNSDSVSIGVSTVNPFYGHLYVVGQFHRPECVTTARNASKEIQLTVGLTSCDVQKQFMLNPKGAMFETNVVLKFHPYYNTHKDKVFSVQCFYPEKASKVPKKLLDNRMALSDSSNQSLKMPCTYKLVANANDQCKIEDVRVGDQIVHSWACNRDIFDTYQSMMVHSCVLVDLNSGTNRTVIDENGCSRDASVMDTPDYVEPLTAFAVGKAVKFPDSPLIQMRCHLKFCDRLLGECDAILPPRCRNRRNAVDVKDSTIRRRTPQDSFPLEARSFDFLDDSDYEEQPETTTTVSLPPLVTFGSAHLDKKSPPMPPRRRTPFDQHVFASAGREPEQQQNGSLISENLFPPGTIVTGIEPIGLARPIITSGRTVDGQPRVIEFPIGGMDFKLNTQDVAIVSNERLKERIQKAMKARTDDIALMEQHDTPKEQHNQSTKKASKKDDDVKVTKPIKETILRTQTTPATSTSTTHITSPPTALNTADPFQQVAELLRELSQPDDDIPESLESVEELEPAVRLEQRIASLVQLDGMSLESQVLNVRDLEIMRDPARKDKWCKK